MIHVLGSQAVELVIVILITLDCNNDVTCTVKKRSFHFLNLGSKSSVILLFVPFVKTRTHTVPPHPGSAVRIISDVSGKSWK